MVYPPSMERNQDNIHLPLQKCLKQILSEMLSLSRNADLMVEKAHWSHRRLSYWSSAADSSSALVEEGGGGASTHQIAHAPGRGWSCQHMSC